MSKSPIQQFCVFIINWFIKLFRLLDLLDSIQQRIASFEYKLKFILKLDNDSITWNYFKTKTNSNNNFMDKQFLVII